MSQIDKLLLGEEIDELTTVTTFTIDIDAKKAIEYLSSINKKLSKQDIFKSIIKNSDTNINSVKISPINYPVIHKQRLKKKYIDFINSVCATHSINRDEFISSSLIEQYNNIRSYLKTEINDIRAAHKEIISLNNRIDLSINRINKNKFLKNQYSLKLNKVKESINKIEVKMKSFLDLEKEGL